MHYYFEPLNLRRKKICWVSVMLQYCVSKLLQNYIINCWVFSRNYPPPISTISRHLETAETVFLASIVATHWCTTDHIWQLLTMEQIQPITIWYIYTDFFSTIEDLTLNSTKPAPFIIPGEKKNTSIIQQNRILTITHWQWNVQFWTFVICTDSPKWNTFVSIFQSDGMSRNINRLW